MGGRSRRYIPPKFGIICKKCMSKSDLLTYRTRTENQEEVKRLIDLHENCEKRDNGVTLLIFSLLPLERRSITSGLSACILVHSNINAATRRTHNNDRNQCRTHKKEQSVPSLVFGSNAVVMCLTPSWYLRGKKILICTPPPPPPRSIRP